MLSHMARTHRLFLMALPALFAMVLVVFSRTAVFAQDDPVGENVEVGDPTGVVSESDLSALESEIEQSLEENPTATLLEIEPFVEVVIEDNRDNLEDPEFRVQVTMNLIVVEIEFDLECNFTADPPLIDCTVV